MDLAGKLGQWRARMQEAFGCLHGHQINAICDAVQAMILAGHCQLTLMAIAGPGSARVPSVERRLQRLLANGRIGVDVCAERWARMLLKGSRDITLMLDETPQHNHLRVMKLSWQLGGRAIPLLWRCYRPNALLKRQDRLVLELVKQARRVLPTEARVTLMTDRGLCWPSLIKLCEAHGWHYLMRLQSQTRLRLDDDSETAVGDLVHKPGQHWRGPGWVFKKAGWLRANVVAWWHKDCQEAWLVVTNLAPTRARCRQAHASGAKLPRREIPRLSLGAQPRARPRARQPSAADHGHRHELADPPGPEPATQRRTQTPATHRPPRPV